jgi:hypothetical protein
MLAAGPLTSRFFQLKTAMTTHDASTPRLRAALAGARVLFAGWRLQRLLKYNPNWATQPRIPAGSGRESGRWTDGGATGRETLLAQADAGEGFNVDLLDEEASGGHAVRLHVGKSAEFLLGRVRGERAPLGPFAEIRIYRAGSFPSLAAATKLVNATLARNRTTVDMVANGALPTAFLRATFRSQTGIEAFQEGAFSQPYVRDTFGVGVRIVHDAGRRNGFRIVTAYPRND